MSFREVIFPARSPRTYHMIVCDRPGCRVEFPARGTKSMALAAAIRSGVVVVASRMGEEMHYCELHARLVEVA